MLLVRILLVRIHLTLPIRRRTSIVPFVFDVFLPPSEQLADLVVIHLLQFSNYHEWANFFKLESRCSNISILDHSLLPVLPTLHSSFLWGSLRQFRSLTLCKPWEECRNPPWAGSWSSSELLPPGTWTEIVLSCLPGTEKVNIIQEKV